MVSYCLVLAHIFVKVPLGTKKKFFLSQPTRFWIILAFLGGEGRVIINITIIAILIKLNHILMLISIYHMQ